MREIMDTANSSEYSNFEQSNLEQSNYALGQDQFRELRPSDTY